MTDPSHNAQPTASARIRAGGELSVTTHSLRETELRDSDQDALQVLLQASAAAEGLQRRFSELQRLQANLVSERNQLGADRTAFESRAREFAEQVAFAVAEMGRIQGIGEVNPEKLVHSGYLTIEGVLAAEVSDLMEVEGFTAEDARAARAAAEKYYERNAR